MAACIATWPFGLTAVTKCKEQLLDNSSALDAVEQGVTAVEEDEELGRYLVGRGGLPTAAGQLELDAAIMDGQTGRFGAVASLQGVACAMPVARLVLEKSRHSMLVGAGAGDFAKAHGIAMESRDALLGERSMRRYQEYLEGQKNTAKGHDTLGLIALDRNKNITVGVATSGMPFKEAGRVGDSPLPGAGLYADGRYGAACATGDGDHILRFSPSSRVVALLASLSPTQACREVVEDIVRVWREKERGSVMEMGIIAMNTQGEIGAATTIASWTDEGTGEEYPGFPYAVWSESSSQPETVQVAKAEHSS